MANLATHYKERTPEETIQIIKDFFKKNKYIINQVSLNQSECGTWYCHIDLYKNNVYLQGANGKGMTKEYALASGYAELYERFCNKTNFIANPIWIKTFMRTNKLNNGYYFSPEERLLTYDEVISYPRINNYFNKLADNNSELVKEAIEFVTDGTYVGVPMYNIENKNDILYMDPRILRLVERTNGMSAGNTLNEALVQGCSEIIERLVTNIVMYNIDNITYNSINLNNINNIHLQEIINNIKNLGYDLYIFDFSYNYHLPVLMSLIIDRKMGLLRTNFGSFPVFDIAAERILTELYQGINTIKNIDIMSKLQIPYKSASKNDILEEYSTSMTGRILPNIFNNIEYVDTYNTDIFINENKNNDELLEYYKKMYNTTGLKFYYMDNSLDKRMYAIHIFATSDETQYLHLPMYYYDFTKNFEEINMCLYSLKILKEFYKHLYENTVVDVSQFINFLNMYKDNFNLMCFIHGILLWNGIFIAERKYYADFSILSILLDTFNYNLDLISMDITDSEIYLSYKKYIQLMAYIKTGQYSIEELLSIFNNIFHYNITNEDIIKCNSPAYLIQKTYIEPFYKYIKSNDFNEIIKTYTNGGIYG